MPLDPLLKSYPVDPRPLPDVADPWSEFPDASPVVASTAPDPWAEFVDAPQSSFVPFNAPAGPSYGSIVGQNLGDAGTALGRGFVDTNAAMLKGAGFVADDLAQATLDPVDNLLKGLFPNIPTAPPRQRGTGSLTRAGESLNTLSSELLPPPEGPRVPSEKFVFGDVPQAVGSTAAFVGPSMVTGGGAGAIALTGALAGMSSAIDDAKKANLSEKDSREYIYLMGLVGTSEALPFERFFAAAEPVKKLIGAKVLRNIAAQSIEEGGQEYVQNFAQKFDLERRKNPKQDLALLAFNTAMDPDVLRGAAAGAVTGGLFGLGASASEERQGNQIYKAAKEMLPAARFARQQELMDKAEQTLKESSDVFAPIEQIARGMQPTIEPGAPTREDTELLPPPEPDTVPSGSEESIIQAMAQDVVARSPEVAQELAGKEALSRSEFKKLTGRNSSQGGRQRFLEEIRKAVSSQVKEATPDATTQTDVQGEVIPSTAEVSAEATPPTGAQKGGVADEEGNQEGQGRSGLLIPQPSIPSASGPATTEAPDISIKRLSFSGIQDALDDLRRADSPNPEYMKALLAEADRRMGFPKGREGDVGRNIDGDLRIIGNDGYEHPLNGDGTPNYRFSYVHHGFDPESAGNPASTEAPPSPKIGYEEFKKQYKDAFDQGNKYTPDQAGFGHYAEKMAELADAHPEYLTRFEEELNQEAKKKPTKSETEDDAPPLENLIYSAKLVGVGQFSNSEQKTLAEHIRASGKPPEEFNVTQKWVDNVLTSPEQRRGNLGWPKHDDLVKAAKEAAGITDDKWRASNPVHKVLFDLIHTSHNPVNDFQNQLNNIATNTDNEDVRAAISRISKAFTPKRRFGMRMQPTVEPGAVTRDSTELIQPEKPEASAPSLKPEPWQVTREQFAASAPAAETEDDTPTMDRAKGWLKNEKGSPGITIENTYIRSAEQEVDSVKRIVYRDESGTPKGILSVHLNAETKKPELVSIVVDKDSRRKGIASSLYTAAEKAGYDVAAAAGAGGYTKEGAMLAHARAVKKAVAEGKAVPAEVLKDYPGLKKAAASGPLFSRARAVGLTAFAKMPSDVIEKRIAEREARLPVGKRIEKETERQVQIWEGRSFENFEDGGDPLEDRFNATYAKRYELAKDAAPGLPPGVSPGQSFLVPKLGVLVRVLDEEDLQSLADDGKKLPAYTDKEGVVRLYVPLDDPVAEIESAPFYDPESESINPLYIVPTDKTAVTFSESVRLATEKNSKEAKAGKKAAFAKPPAQKGATKSVMAGIIEKRTKEEILPLKNEIADIKRQISAKKSARAEALRAYKSGPEIRKIGGLAHDSLRAGALKIEIENMESRKKVLQGKLDILLKLNEADAKADAAPAEQPKEQDGSLSEALDIARSEADAARKAYDEADKVLRKIPRSHNKKRDAQAEVVKRLYDEHRKTLAKAEALLDAQSDATAARYLKSGDPVLEMVGKMYRDYKVSEKDSSPDVMDFLAQRAIDEWTKRYPDEAKALSISKKDLKKIAQESVGMLVVSLRPDPDSNAYSDASLASRLQSGAKRFAEMNGVAQIYKRMENALRNLEAYSTGRTLFSQEIVNEAFGRDFDSRSEFMKAESKRDIARMNELADAAIKDVDARAKAEVEAKAAAEAKAKEDEATLKALAGSYSSKHLTLSTSIRAVAPGEDVSGSLSAEEAKKVHAEVVSEIRAAQKVLAEKGLENGDKDLAFIISIPKIGRWAVASKPDSVEGFLIEFKPDILRTPPKASSPSRFRAVGASMPEGANAMSQSLPNKTAGRIKTPDGKTWVTNGHVVIQDPKNEISIRVAGPHQNLKPEAIGDVLPTAPDSLPVGTIITHGMATDAMQYRLEPTTPLKQVAAVALKFWQKNSALTHVKAKGEDFFFDTTYIAPAMMMYPNAALRVNPKGKTAVLVEDGEVKAQIAGIQMSEEALRNYQRNIEPVENDITTDSAKAYAPHEMPDFVPPDAPKLRLSPDGEPQVVNIGTEFKNDERTGLPFAYDDKGKGLPVAKILAAKLAGSSNDELQWEAAELSASDDADERAEAKAILVELRRRKAPIPVAISTGTYNLSFYPYAKGVSIPKSEYTATQGGTEPEALDSPGGMSPALRRFGNFNKGLIGNAKALPQLIRDLGMTVGREVKQGRTGRMTKGRSRGPSPAGQYFPSSTLVKIKAPQDVLTALHEVAHAVDHIHQVMAPFISAKRKTTIDQELAKFWVFGSVMKTGPRSRLEYKRREGFAEWMKTYLINPIVAKAEGPRIYNAYLKAVPEDVRDQLDAVGRQIQVTFTADPVQKIAVQIRDGKPLSVSEKLQKAMKGEGWDFEVTWWDKVPAFANRFHYLEKAMNYAKTIRGIDKLLPQDDPKILSRVWMGRAEKINDIFEHGMIDARGNRIAGKGGWKWIFEPIVGKDGGVSEEAQKKAAVVLIAERTIEKTDQLREELDATYTQLAKKRLAGTLSPEQHRAEVAKARDAFEADMRRVSGIGLGVDSDEKIAAEAISKMIGDDPEGFARFKEVARRYRQWGESLMQYAVDKGRMSQEEFDKITKSNRFYSSFRRWFEDETSEIYGAIAPKNALGAVRMPFKRFKGSSRMMEDPFLSMMIKTGEVISEADRNEAMAAMVKLLTGDTTMAEDPENLAAVGYRVPAGEEGAIKVWVKGELQHWKFQKDLHASLKGLGGVQSHPLWNIVSIIPQITRIGVTYFPAFLVRQVPRDAMSRFIITENNSTLKDTLKWMKPEERSEVLRMGVGQAGHYSNRPDVFYRRQQEYIQQQKKGDLFVTMRNAVRGYQRLAEDSDLHNRVVEYRAAYAKGKASGLDDYNARLYAAFQARDLMDFAVASDLLREINKVFIFTNAAVQSLRREFRAVNKAVMEKINEGELSPETRKKLGVWITRMAMATLPLSLLEYGWNASGGDDDEREFWNQPAYLRDLFWSFKVGDDTWVRIPKPYGLGMLSSATSRMIAFARGDRNAFSGLAGSAARSIAPIDESAILGPFRTYAEVLLNRDTFRDRYIIPPWESDLEVSRRKGTKYASNLGQIMQKVTGLDGRTWDHIIRGQFSSAGDMAIAVSEMEPRRIFGKTVGLTVTSPGPMGRDVQYVMGIASKRGKTSTNEFEPIKNLRNAYFRAETREEKEQLSKRLSEVAGRMRKRIENGTLWPPEK